MKRLATVLCIALLALSISLPATADRRHHGGYKDSGSPHYQQDRRWDKGQKHHRKHRYSAPRRYHHRAGPPRRIVEHNYDSERPRRHYRGHDRHRYRGHTDIPLVSVDGYPLVRIQVNH
jgi:hypothetical protein